MVLARIDFSTCSHSSANIFYLHQLVDMLSIYIGETMHSLCIRWSIKILLDILLTAFIKWIVYTKCQSVCAWEAHFTTTMHACDQCKCSYLLMNRTNIIYILTFGLIQFLYHKLAIAVKCHEYRCKTIVWGTCTLHKTVVFFMAFPNFMRASNVASLHGLLNTWGIWGWVKLYTLSF